jgi:hypothetical protein
MLPVRCASADISAKIVVPKAMTGDIGMPGAMGRA